MLHARGDCNGEVLKMRLIDANALKASAMQVTETNEISFNNCFPYWQFSKCIEQAPCQ